MSTPCSGAVSTPKSGIPAGIVVDQQYVQSLLPPALAFLYPYLPFMQGLAIGDVTAFCLADPPSFSVPAPGQFLDFLTGGNFANYKLVNTFLQDVTRAYLWNSICQCTGGGTPTAPTPPTDPGTLPVVNPTNVVSLPLTSRCGNVGPLTSMVAGTAGAFRGYLIFAGFAATSVLVTIVNAISNGTGRSSRILLSATDANGTEAAGNFETNVSTSPGATSTYTYLVTPGVQGLEVDVTDIGGTGESIVTVTADVYCGQIPGTPGTPCCPPDPQLVGQINSILTAVTLLQRQLAPFAYVTGGIHAGLTGQGSFAVQGLLGVKIAVTTLPASFGNVIGTPTYYFDLGWLSVLTGDGFIDERRLTASAQVWTPDLMSEATLVGYSLATGVVATITELIREP